MTFGNLVEGDGADGRGLVQPEPDISEDDDDEGRKIEQHDQPGIERAVERRHLAHGKPDHAADRHRHDEGRHDAPQRDAELGQEVAMHRFLVDIFEHRAGPGQQPALRDLGGDEPDQQEARDGEDRDERAAQEARPRHGLGAGKRHAHGLPPCQNVPGASSVPGPDQLLAAELAQELIENLGVGLVLGDRSLGDALAIAAPQRLEGRVVEAGIVLAHQRLQPLPLLVGGCEQLVGLRRRPQKSLQPPRDCSWPSSR